MADAKLAAAEQVDLGVIARDEDAGTLAAGTGAGTKELMYRLGHAGQQAALR